VKRIDQWLANLGYCSRREARDWADDERITVDGVVQYDPSRKVAAEALRVDGEPLDHPEGMLLMMNKPLEVVCSHDQREGRRVYDLLPERWFRRNPVVTSIGRLDRDTTGLLLLTDQSALVHLLTSPKHKVPKVYRVKLETDVDPDRQRQIWAVFASGGMRLDDDPKPCLPAELKWLGPRDAEMTLTEGRYHQVRRMFGGQGFAVVELQRIRFGGLQLPPDLALGAFVELPLGQAIFSSGP
jgi:16S rRNA pseudouridine516 synthase